MAKTAVFCSLFTCLWGTVSARTPFTAFAQSTLTRGSVPAMPQHTTGEAPVDDVEVKPDLECKTFSPQSAYCFGSLSQIAYSPKKEAMGLVKGNSTCEGLGFDQFYWFEGGKAAQESAFDAIHDTEAFIAANDDIIAVVFRGTKEVSDWATNLNLRTRDCPPEWVGAGILHEGFDDGINSVWECAGMYDKIKSLYNDKEKKRKLYITGHSLGGALATVATARLAFVDDIEIAALYTFGSPKVFDQTTANAFNAKDNYGTPLGKKYFRCRNNNDIVPRVPIIPYQHVGKEIYLDRFGTISETSLWDRVLGRMSALLRGEVMEDVNDHATSEYIRIFKQVVLNSKVSLLDKASSVVQDAVGNIAQKVTPEANTKVKQRDEAIQEVKKAAKVASQDF